MFLIDFETDSSQTSWASQRPQYGRQAEYKEIIGLCRVTLCHTVCHIIIPDLISDVIHKIAADSGVRST